MPRRSRDVELRDVASLLVRPEAARDIRDWARIVRRAVDERVAPLLHHALPAHAPIPDALRLVLRRELYRSGALAQLRFGELRRLLESGSLRGLAMPVVLKGAALATSLYEDVALRPMSDVDLLVPEAELTGWLEAGRELGLEPLGPEMAPGLTERLHYQHAIANDRAMIELHFGLVGGRSDWRAPETERLRERAEPWAPPPGVGGPGALQLSPSAHLLYACAHAMLQHGAAQSPLGWLYDIHAMATLWRDRIAWNELPDFAPSLRWSAGVSGALALSRELFGTSLPDGLEESLAAPASEKAHAQRKASPELSRAELVWREMGCVGLRDRARWALAILFPSPAYMRWRYPGARRFWPACYPYRLWLVLREGIGALVRRPRVC